MSFSPIDPRIAPMLTMRGFFNSYCPPDDPSGYLISLWRALVSMRGATTLTLKQSFIILGLTPARPVRLVMPPLLIRHPRPTEEVSG